MGTIKSCVFAPDEAKLIAAGNTAAISFLKQEICSSLSTESTKDLQKQFQSVVTATPQAVAFIWRGNTVETFQYSHMPTVKSCANSATPLRCAAVLSLGQGKLSQMTAAMEEKALGKATCDWRKKKEEQNKKWVQFLKKNKSISDGPKQRAALIQTHPGYEESFASLQKFSENDAQLLGVLTFIGPYMRHINMQMLETGASMLSMVCSQKTDCNTISTQVIDYLWLAAVPHLERVDSVTMVGHTTLRIRLENGSFIYFNNGSKFLPANYYRGKTLLIDSSWQILGGNLGDIGRKLYARGEIKAAIAALRSALAITPKNKNLHYDLGVALCQDNNNDGAIAEFDKAVKIDAKYVDALNNWAAILIQRGNFDDAIAKLNVAFAADPKNTSVIANLKMALKQKAKTNK